MCGAVTARNGFVLVLLLLMGASVQAATLPDVIERVKPSVVAIGTAITGRPERMTEKPLTFRGTGFVVGNGRQIITNYHVIAKPWKKERETLAVFSGEGNSAKARPARIVRIDKAHDLALLDIPPPALKPFKLGKNKLRDGDSVAFTGFPLGFVLGLNRVTHRGMVSAITPLVTPVPDARHLKPEHVRRLRQSSSYVYQLDATAYPGNSGSPVYEVDTGMVVAVINSVFVKKTKETAITDPTGISYAIPAVYVNALLDGSGGTMP